MADQKQTKHARQVYNTLCLALKNADWHFNADDERMSIKFDASGDGLNMFFYVNVSAERQSVQLFSKLPFKFSVDGTVNGAVATSVINYTLALGCFDFNAATGDVIFRMVTNFHESIISESALLFFVKVAASIIDEYNDLLYMYARGLIDLDGFIEKVNEQ